MPRLPFGRLEHAVTSCRVVEGIALLAILGCSGATEPMPAPELREISTPAGAGSLGPNLAKTSEGVFLTWLEPAATEAGGEPSHALRVAKLDLAGGSRPTWSEPATVTVSGAVFANWADFPALTALPNGGLVAHWLARIGDDTYAYGVRLASSRDGGRNWEQLGFLHDDLSPTEHGFVAWVALDNGARAFWLDGRGMATEGPMALHTVTVEGDARAFADLPPAAPPSSTVLDERVCECCQTDAAMTEDGPVVVYRDRSDDEVRDISIVRATGTGWSAPRRVFDDGWRIAGCPVNGPAVAAAGRHVVVAWFTGAGDGPAVKVALSRNAGADFAPPLVLDESAPIGRVDVALAGETAWVTWLGRDAEGASAVRLRPLHLERDGSLRAGDASTLAETGAARASGFPRLLALDDGHLLVAWVDTGNEGHIRAALVAVDSEDRT